MSTAISHVHLKNVDLIGTYYYAGLPAEKSVLFRVKLNNKFTGGR
jgi:hypothetical protein